MFAPSPSSIFKDGGKRPSGGTVFMNAKLNESYRAAALELRSAFLERRFRAVLFSAVRPGGGTTSAVLGVARQLSDSYGLRLLVIELAGGRGALTEIFSLDGARGLAAISSCTAATRDCLQEAGGLIVIPSGAIEPGDLQDPAPALERIMREVGEEFDSILIDAPAISEGTCAVEAVRAVPDVVLVVESGRTQFEELERTRALLDRHKARIVGAVLSKQRSFLPKWLDRFF